ncbi:MAG: penicillin-insensitive murein endopeptidase [Bdellovibrionota bacterium]
MKILLLFSLFLTAFSAFAQKDLSVSLPLRDGDPISFSGKISESGAATLTNSTSRTSVAEAQVLGNLTVIDLYERGEQGIQHSQFALRAGALSQVREKKINAEESLGLFIGRPLSDAGKIILGVRQLVASLETPEQRDARLAPWLDLSGGGIAVGSTDTITVKKPDGSVENTYGSLVTATQLPAQGEGFRRVRYEDQFWGTGMMISMIDRASAEFVTKHPDLFVYVGAVAREHGGFFPPHKSHQSGLDADIPYIGTKGFETQLEKDGSVKKSFLTEKNWDYYRLLMSQRIFDNGKEFPAVSMILVDPRLKTHFCEFAKTQNLTSPLDLEILRRMRPTEGHDDHFHLRLRCSPHHPLCLRQNYDPKETGCS